MPEISDEEKQMLLTNVRPPGKPSVEEALKSALSSRPPKK
jgi:hypothetical protein